MKKLALIIIVPLFAFSVINAQSPSEGREDANESMGNMGTTINSAPSRSTGSESVSVLSKNSFGIDFPRAADISWQKSGDYDQVEFVSDGQKLTGYYDIDGSLIGTITDKKLSDLPEKAQRILSDKYADYKVGPIIFYHDNDRNDANMVLWATEFDSEDLYFAQLEKGPDKIVVRITPSGDVSYFTQIK